MANKIYGSNNEPLKIQFITDTHYYSRKNCTEGSAYEKDESKSQMVGFPRRTETARRRAYRSEKSEKLNIY